MQRARVLIRNKPGVFDPQGKVVHSGLRRLGHESVQDVRVGKVIDLRFASGSPDELRARIERMCSEFLVNPVIEDYTIQFLDEE
ncbi:MAG: phosphoribosylformylglycinamidine synthase subunit PurS [Bradymonadaceae bacterium]|nr:phosphoribosylformylglycinamidine synthase subunit PurS [Lujinxingiaceae bacterium]